MEDFKLNNKVKFNKPLLFLFKVSNFTVWLVLDIESIPSKIHLLCVLKKVSLFGRALSNRKLLTTAGLKLSNSSVLQEETIKKLKQAILKNLFISIELQEAKKYPNHSSY